MNDSSSLLTIQNLTKSYSGVTVLDHVSFSVPYQSILGLIGENGAGKSTLIKCINGVTRPDSGKIFFNGAEYHPSINNALHAGIVTIPQEINLADSLTIRENIFLGREIRHYGFLNHAAMRAATCDLLDELRCELSPDTPVSNLNIAMKQMVEIARAISQECRLLIMDEPSTVLNPAEVENLFRIMRSMQKRGISTIYVSHKLGEVKTICDTVTILRDGEFICQCPTAGMTTRDMANQMVGRELKGIFPEKIMLPPEAPVLLEISNISHADRVKDVSLTLHKGEILGLAGLGGAGRTELAETLYGIRKRSAGHIRINGQEVFPDAPSKAVKAGIAYLSEDRQKSGVIQQFSVTWNISLISLLKYCFGPFIRKKSESAKARSYQERFHIKAASLTEPIRSLSGGNQQKAAIAKSLDGMPQIFIFDEPTRGIDIRSRREVYHFIYELASEGMACLVISSDLEEIIGLCPKVAVMRDGAIAGFLEGEHINEKEIMYLAAGVKNE